MKNDSLFSLFYTRFTHGLKQGTNDWFYLLSFGYYQPFKGIKPTFLS
jgi:hypothetical protein